MTIEQARNAFGFGGASVVKTLPIDSIVRGRIVLESPGPSPLPSILRILFGLAWIVIDTGGFVELFDDELAALRVLLRLATLVSSFTAILQISDLPGPVQLHLRFVDGSVTRLDFAGRHVREVTDALGLLAPLDYTEKVPSQKPAYAPGHRRPYFDDDTVLSIDMSALHGCEWLDGEREVASVLPLSKPSVVDQLANLRNCRADPQLLSQQAEVGESDMRLAIEGNPTLGALFAAMMSAGLNGDIPFLLNKQCAANPLQ